MMVGCVASAGSDLTSLFERVRLRWADASQPVAQNRRRDCLNSTARPKGPRLSTNPPHSTPNKPGSQFPLT